ncbi:IMP dehydrogenase [Candidatus Nomurabacteria bacterium]|nr:IMP dehydrogenase [Candidatus Nomurabacteria bacterium]
MEIKTALTYDDVLLVPQKSELKSRKETDVSTQLSKNIRLNTPLLPANMDTVTESQMAIVMAYLGSIGIIHRFCDIDYQVREVKKVKRKQNVVIDEPFTISPQSTLKELREKIIEHNCQSFLVSSDGQNLEGIITSRDIDFVKDENTKVSEMMTTKEKLITAPVGIDIEKAKKILSDNKVEKLPIVDGAFRIKGLITATDIIRNYNNGHASKDAKGRLLVGAAVGAGDDYMERVKALVEAEVDVLVVDIAHGHSVNAIQAIKKIKEAYPSVDVIGGNVATAQGAEDLIKAGADAIKVGIGPGSICTTRITTGFGVPQLTAILNIAPVCHKYKIPLIADGGIKQPGDMVKALAAGADSVMMGGQFSGTEETPGPVLSYKGQQYKISRGMASLTAALSRPNAKEKMDQVTPEGVEARVPFRGPAKNVINLYIGGLRSGMSYANARNIQELQKNATFVRITNAGLTESHSHDNQVL